MNQLQVAGTGIDAKRANRAVSLVDRVKKRRPSGPCVPSLQDDDVIGGDPTAVTAIAASFEWRT